MIKPSDEELRSLSSGMGPREFHHDGSVKYNPAQTQLGAVLWLDLDFTAEQIRKIVFAVDRVPDEIIEMVASELVDPDTRPDKKPTRPQIVEMYWTAMQANAAIYGFCEARKQRHKSDLDDA